MWLVSEGMSRTRGKREMKIGEGDASVQGSYVLALGIIIFAGPD